MIRQVETLQKSWDAEFADKIEEFGALLHGWDTYEAEPPNSTARYWAKEALLLLRDMDFRPNRVAPSVEGGIACVWRQDEKRANIEFFNSDEIFAAIRDANDDPVVWEVTPEKLSEASEIIRGYLTQ